MTHHTFVQVLESLFVQSGQGQACDAGAIARRLGLRASEVGAALVVLERRGLVDAERVRLTLPGLAVAASLRARRRRSAA